MSSMPAPDTPIERETLRRLYWRILPFLVLCYIVAFL